MVEEKNLQLGHLGRDISDTVNTIVDQILSSSDAIVSAECEIPDGFVKIPDKSAGKDLQIHRSRGTCEKVGAALSAALPAGLAALALAFNAPSAVVVILTGTGGVAGSFIQHTTNAGRMQLDDLNLQQLELFRLTPGDVKVRLTVDEEKKQALEADAKRKIDSLCAEIAEYEKKVSETHDIAVDKAFGEWAQSFLMYADSHPEDRKLQLMRDELVNRLARMRIHVYDEVTLNEEGKPDVPIQDYLIDSRESEQYKKVLRPAIYSDRSILARGEIV